MITVNHEYYVSLEVVMLLKKAGFDWKCNGAYLSEDGTQYAFVKMDEACDNNNSKYNQYNISAPTLEVAQRWLREVKGISVEVYHEIVWVHDSNLAIKWAYNVCYLNSNESDVLPFGEFDTFEAALEAGLRECLTLLIEKQ